MELMLLTALVLAVVVLPFPMARQGRRRALALPWLLPAGLLAWSFLESRTEAECYEACASGWLFVGAILALAPAGLGTVGAAIGLRLHHRATPGR